MMFQSYALFPHLSVAGNVAFGLRQENAKSRGDRTARRRDAGAVKPDRIRRAANRSILRRPAPAGRTGALAENVRGVLLDEPLAALDKKLRAETQFELMALQRDSAYVHYRHPRPGRGDDHGRPYRCHAHGKLVQVGTPAEIYERPKTRWVAEFIGEVNHVRGTGCRAIGVIWWRSIQGRPARCRAQRLVSTMVTLHRSASGLKNRNEREAAPGELNMVPGKVVRNWLSGRYVGLQDADRRPDHEGRVANK